MLQACECKTAVHSDEKSPGGNYLCVFCGNVCCSAERKDGFETLMYRGFYLMARCFGPLPSEVEV